MREITHNEVSKLYDCIHELSEYHNKTSVNFKGYYPLNPYENILECFENALRKKESYIAVIPFVSCVLSVGSSWKQRRSIIRNH